MIAINGLSKVYQRKTVLNDICLNFEASKTHVLLGSSGSGKSTLLRLILGLIRADKGEIYLGDLKVTAENQREVASQVGYVIQDGGLFPHMTAARNITLVASLMKWSNQKIQQRKEELASLVDLSVTLLDRYPRQLSGGQRQRVGLMRSLFLNPRVLLLDEPLGALDPLVRSNVQHELKPIFNKLQKTVILVTHDLAEAAFFGHTITLLHEGRIQQTGTFIDLVKKPANDFVREFIRSQKPPPELKELE